MAEKAENNLKLPDMNGNGWNGWKFLGMALWLEMA